MKTELLVVIGLVGALLAAPAARAADEEGTLEGAAKKALAGGADPRRLAVQAFEPALAVLDVLIQKSAERPERVAALWETALAEHLQRWRAVVDTAGSPAVKRAPPAGWKEFRKLHEGFIGELRSPGREVAVWRRQTRLQDDALKLAVESFPARRAEWQKRIDAVEKTLTAARGMLSQKDPGLKQLDAMLRELASAGALAGNVGADAEAVQKQVKASFGVKAELPAPIAKAQQRFAGIDDPYRDLPESWRAPVRAWAALVKKVQAEHAAAQAQFDRTFEPVLKATVFTGSPSFKDKAYPDFTRVVAAIELQVRALRNKVANRPATPEQLEEDRRLNAEECKQYKEYREATSPSVEREAQLKHARGCSVKLCRDKQLEAARGPCSVTAIREASLTLSREGLTREEALEFEREVLKNKGNTAEDRARIEARIKQLEQPNAKEREAHDLIVQCDKGTHPGQQKIEQSARNVCDNTGPECKQFNDEHKAHRDRMDKLIEEQRKRDRKRDARRKKLGLKPDYSWRDCP